MTSQQSTVPTFKVNLATENKTLVEIDLLDDDHLRPFGITAQQVRDVSICFDVPGYLYEEIGEASKTHPCAGSACMIFSDPLDRVCSSDFIAYHDSNPAKSHAEGREHWNDEIRYMQNGREIGRSNRFAGHVIQDSGEITLTAEFDGTTHEQKIQRSE